MASGSVNEKPLSSTFGTSINIPRATAYTFPSNGYIWVAAHFDPHKYIYVYLAGSDKEISSSEGHYDFMLGQSVANNGVPGWQHLSCPVSKGMQVLWGGDSTDSYVKFVPYS